MKRILFLGAVAAALAGCASQPNDFDEMPLAVASSSIYRVQAATDNLASALKRANLGSAPVLVASLVRVDNLKASSTMGKIVGEQIGARLAARGIPVHEVKLRDSLFVSERGGEFILSREAKDLSAAYRAKVVVAGTYAVSGNQVLVTLKAIDANTGVVVAGNSFSVPRSEVWGMLEQ